MDDTIYDMFRLSVVVSRSWTFDPVDC